MALSVCGGHDRTGEDFRVCITTPVARGDGRRGQPIVSSFEFQVARRVATTRRDRQTFRCRGGHGASFVSAIGALGTSQQPAGIERRSGTVVARGDPVGGRAGGAGFRRAAGFLAVGAGRQNPRPTGQARPSRTPVHRENVARGFGSAETFRERQLAG